MSLLTLPLPHLAPNADFLSLGALSCNYLTLHVHTLLTIWPTCHFTIEAGFFITATVSPGDLPELHIPHCKSAHASHAGPKTDREWFLIKVPG